MSNKKKSLKNLPTTQKIVFGAISAVEFGLKVLAWYDISQRKPGELRGPKWFWTTVQGVNFIGPIAYFAFARKPKQGK